MSLSTQDFYLRYYIGHKGKFGHEFLEFEFRPDGKLRFVNNKFNAAIKLSIIHLNSDMQTIPTTRTTQ